MLFGYRGSEVVDVAEVERLIQRVAQLQNDLPQVSALELSLVLAGADGRHRADRRAPGSTRSPTRARTGSCAGCPSRPGTPCRPEPLGGGVRVTDCTHAQHGPPRTTTAPLELRRRHRPHRLLPRGRRRRRRRAPSPASRSSRSSSTTSRRSSATRCAATCRVVVLTPTRLILAHTDEHDGDDLLPEPYTSTSTEAIRLSRGASVVVTRMIANPTSGPEPAGRGRDDHRLGRREPGRPRAGRLQRPGVRRRPRLHRGARLRRLLAAGLGRGRRRRRRRRAALLRRVALRAHPRD